MKRFTDRSVAGRAEAHALVIGIGAYPHLVDGTGRLFSQAGTLKQLTSPPVSAKAFATWLEKKYNGSGVQLGTLMLLVSDPADADADAPTMENIRTAVKEWRRRAHTSTDHVALFYFCGHGVSAGVHDGLLASDFGADDDAALENVIDIGGLQLAMDGCKARRQAFFIDACRNTPEWLVKRVVDGGIGHSILDAQIRQGQYGDRDAPRYFATSSSQLAYGRPNGLSLFTEALIETLESAGAEKEKNRWIVKTDTIQPGLNRMLAILSERDRLPFRKASLDRSSGYEFHVLPGPPDVHVSVTCEPPAANDVADLALRGGDAQWVPRPARDGSTWRLKQPVGQTDVRATFSGREYPDVEVHETIWTPVSDFTLPVKP